MWIERLLERETPMICLRSTMVLPTSCWSRFPDLIFFLEVAKTTVLSS